jgi:hypothetical protein
MGGEHSRSRRQRQPISVPLNNGAPPIVSGKIKLIILKRVKKETNQLFIQCFINTLWRFEFLHAI